MNKKSASIVGWYGVAAILLAYALLSFGLIEAKGYIYQLLNLTGAIGIVVVAVSKNDKQPAVLNVVWAAIALVAIIQLLLS